jgi:hypothetical protein
MFGKGTYVKNKKREKKIPNFIHKIRFLLASGVIPFLRERKILNTITENCIQFFAVEIQFNIQSILMSFCFSLPTSLKFRPSSKKKK